MKPDCLVILSGGMDSSTLLHYVVKELKRRPLVLTYQYGQKHFREVQAAGFQSSGLGLDHTVIDLSSFEGIFRRSSLTDPGREIPRVEDVVGDSQPPTYVPHRNLIFLSLAAGLAESNGVSEIFYGAQRGDLYGYWDCTIDFLDRLNWVLDLNRETSVRVLAPFVDWSKSQVLRKGLEIGVNYGRTWTCYEGGREPCGVCPTCDERRRAFQEVGIPDPLFDIPPF